MVHGFIPVILIGTVALGAARMLAGRRSASPVVPPHCAADVAVERSVRLTARPAQPAHAATVAIEDIRCIPSGAAYLLGNAPSKGGINATTALLGTMFGPGLCTPHVEDPS